MIVFVKSYSAIYFAFARYLLFGAGASKFAGYQKWKEAQPLDTRMFVYYQAHNLSTSTMTTITRNLPWFIADLGTAVIGKASRILESVF